MKKIFIRTVSIIMVVFIMLTSVPLGGFVGVDFSWMNLGFSASAKIYNAEELPEGLPEYPDASRQYWVIFNEGYRSNQLEMSTFSSDGGSDDLYFVWDKSLIAVSESNQSISTYEQYYYYDGEWVDTGDYRRASDNATRILASNLDIYDENGTLIQGATDINGYPSLKNTNIYYKTGDIVQFGSYPQSKVTDNATVTALNNFAPDWDSWKSYGYFSGDGDYGSMEKGDWMRYIDIDYNGFKYRGVRFKEYRPRKTYDTLTYTPYKQSYQYANGYIVGNTYWFKFESLYWRILDPTEGLVICENIIDAQPYSNTIYIKGLGGNFGYFNDFEYNNYANDYKTSSIRAWLHNDFYNTAFTNEEKNKIMTTVLSNTGYYTSIGDSGYEDFDGDETQDKIFLLSYNDLKNSKYGFDATDSNYEYSKRAKGSDYAKCQGLYVSDNYENSSYWFLRTAGKRSSLSCWVRFTGQIAGDNNTDNNNYVYKSYAGIRPALRLFEVSNSDDDYTNPAIKIIETTHPIINGVLFANINDKTFQVAVGLWDQNQQLVKDSDLKVSVKNKSVQYVSEKHFPEGYVVYTFNILNMQQDNITFESSKYGAEYILPVMIFKYSDIYTCEYIQQYRKDWDCKADADQLYMTDFKCTHSNGASDVTFNVYNTSESYGTVDVISKYGKLKHSYKVDPFKMGSGFELIINGFKYSYIDLTSKEPYYRKESNSEKTPISIKGLNEGDRILITQNPDFSNMVKLYNGLDILISCTLMAVSLDLDAGATKKAIEELIEDMLDTLSETAITALAEEIGEAMIKGSTKDVVENVVQIFGATFEEIGYNYGEVITEIFKNMGHEVVNTAIKFYIPGWAVADTILQATEIAYLITDYTLFDHNEAVTIYSYEHANITKPGKTKNLKSPSQEIDSVSLTWDKVTGADGYRIYKLDTATGKYNSVGYIARDTSYTVKNLSLGSHKFKVRAYLNTDNGPVWGDYSDILTVSTKPGKISGLKASSQATDSITLTWSAVKGADGYRIYKYDSSTGKYPTVGYVAGKTSLKVSKLSVGTKYKFKVRAYKNVNGSPVWGEYTSVLNTATKPAKTTKLKASAKQPDYITLTWNKVAGADGYRVYKYDSVLDKYISVGYTSTGNSYKVSKLTSGNRYKFKVRAYINTDDGAIWGSYTDVITAATKPGKTTGFKASSQTTNSITLTWNKVAGVDGYRIYKYDTIEEKYKSVGYVAGKNSYKVSNLEICEKYNFKVRAYIDDDDGPVWGEYSDIIAVATKPGKTTGLKVSAQTTDSVTLTWNKVAGADGYRIYKYDSLTDTYPTVGYVAANNSFKVSKLSEGTKYKFKVRAYINAGNGPVWGEYTDVITTATKPAKTTNLKTSAQTTESITLSWSAVKGADGYRIYKYDPSTGKYPTVGYVAGKTSFKVSKLTAGTSYSFKVRAYINTDDGPVWGAYCDVYKSSTKK